MTRKVMISRKSSSKRFYGKGCSQDAPVKPEFNVRLIKSGTTG